MPDYDYENLLSSVLNSKPTEFNDTFYDIIIDKMNNCINSKKTEIAQNMFRTVQPPNNPEVENAAEE